MKEEAYLGRGQYVPKHLRHHRQVVVVHPDEVAFPVHVLNGVGEALVHGLEEGGGCYSYNINYQTCKRDSGTRQSVEKVRVYVHVHVHVCV